MKKIDLREKHKNVSVLSYGASRTGKTEFAATFPRPYFMSDASERGWTTITNMNKQKFFEIDREPTVRAIEDSDDVNLCLNEVFELTSKGEVKTLVIDSLTFLAQLFLNKAGKNSNNNMLVYQALATWLRDLRIRCQRMPINVVWLCLEVPPQNSAKGGPDIPGKQASNFPACCDFVFHHVIQDGHFMVRTAAHDDYVVGARGNLPDPLGKMILTKEGEEALQIDSSYKTLALHLGLAPEPIGKVK